MARGPRRSGTIVRTTIVAAAAGTLAACSLLINRTSSQCAVDADCAPFVDTVCVQGGCVQNNQVPEGGYFDVPGEGAAPTPCTTTQDCLGLHGTNWICRRPDQSCQRLTSEDCPLVSGDPTGDDALILGAILPIYGPHASTGAMLVNAVSLALNDFIGGLPPLADGGLNRQVAVVFCDESENAPRAATHLRDDLGLPAILGAGESASTLAVVNGVTFSGGQFLITPRATASLSAYQSAGTVWRTCPSTATEGATLTGLAQSVLGDVKTQRSISSVALAILHANDDESTQLDTTITGGVVLNGAAPNDASNVGHFLDVAYGDPDTDPNPDAEYAAAISQITTAPNEPDVIVVLGSTQAVHGILGGLESGWPARFPRRPIYLVSSGLQTTELLTLASGSADLRSRILGTAPGEDAANYATLARFLALYGETFADGGAPSTFGVAQSYDAFYTLAYAATVARNADLVGKDITRALSVLLTPPDSGAPTLVDVGPDGIPGAFQAITARKPIALQGASAPLDFNLTTGNLVTDVQVWCIVQSADGPAFVNSSEFFSAAKGTMQGSLANGCAD